MWSKEEYANLSLPDRFHILRWRGELAWIPAQEEPWEFGADLLEPYVGFDRLVELFWERWAAEGLSPLELLEVMRT